MLEHLNSLLTFRQTYATDIAIASRTKDFADYNTLRNLAAKESLAPIEVLKVVRSRIQMHCNENMGTISHPPIIVIDQANLATLCERIDPQDAEISGRLQKFSDERKLPDPVAHLVGGVLYRFYNVPKHQAENAARVLFNRVISETPKKIHEVIKEIAISLDEGLLDTGMWYAAFSDSEGTVAEQLKHPFQIASTGLIIRPGMEKQEELGIELPQTLLHILTDLKQPESAQVLEEWITKKLSSDDAEYCINFLRTLVEFTTFLDSPSYFQIYASEQKVASLLPFRSLYQAVSLAKHELEKSTGYEEQIKSLEVTEEIIVSRFHQIFQGPMRLAFETEEVNDLNPLVDDLVSKFWEWSLPLMKNGSLNPEVAAKHAVNFLRIMGIDEIEKFADILIARSYLDEFNGLSEEVAGEIIKEGIRVNAIEDRDGILDALMRNSLRELEQNPWKDLNDFDFSNLFDEGVKKIQIYYTPGTFGPWTNGGHGDFLNKTLAYMDHLDQIDSQNSENGHTKRILVLAPNTKTSRTPNAPKKFERTGDINERVGAIMLQNPKLDHSRVFITTKLQADPRAAGNIAGSINDFHNAFANRLHGNMRSAGRAATQQVEMVLCCGIDEIYKPGKDNQIRLVKKEELNPKFSRAGKTLFVGRHGYLIRALDDCAEILKLVNNADFVLTPGTPFTSSTEAIRHLLRNGDSRSLLATAVPYIVKHWGSLGIKERRDKKEKGKVPSVRNIYNDLIREYNGILVQIGAKLTDH